MIYHGNYCAETVEKLKDTFNKHYHIAAERVEKLIDKVAERTIDLLAFFDIESRDMKPYSQILQDANAELGKLNLTYEQLLLQYKAAKESAERLSRKLQQANHSLKSDGARTSIVGFLP